MPGSHSPVGQDTRGRLRSVAWSTAQLAGTGPTVWPATWATQTSAPRPLAVQRDVARPGLAALDAPAGAEGTSTRVVVVNVSVAVTCLPRPWRTSRWTFVTDGAAGGGGARPRGRGRRRRWSGAGGRWRRRCGCGAVGAVVLAGPRGRRPPSDRPPGRSPWAARGREGHRAGPGADRGGDGRGGGLDGCRRARGVGGGVVARATVAVPVTAGRVSELITQNIPPTRTTARTLSPAASSTLRRVSCSSPSKLIVVSPRCHGRRVYAGSCRCQGRSVPSLVSPPPGPASQDR